MIDIPTTFWQKRLQTVAAETVQLFQQEMADGKLSGQAADKFNHLTATMDKYIAAVTAAGDTRSDAETMPAPIDAGAPAVTVQAIMPEIVESIQAPPLQMLRVSYGFINLHKIVEYDGYNRVLSLSGGFVRRVSESDGRKIKYWLQCFQLK